MATPNLKAVEEALPGLIREPDPEEPAKIGHNKGPDPVDTARDKSKRDVDEITDHTIMEIGKAAQELEKLQEELANERDDIKKRIDRHASFSAKAIKAKVIIADSLVRLREDR